MQRDVSYLNIYKPIIYTNSRDASTSEAVVKVNRGRRK